MLVQIKGDLKHGDMGEVFNDRETGITTVEKAEGFNSERVEAGE